MNSRRKRKGQKMPAVNIQREAKSQEFFDARSHSLSGPSQRKSNCGPSHCHGVLHQVRSKDTLYKLAMAHGITLEAIIAANPQISDPDNLSVGQVVCIPSRTDTLSEIINTLLTAERLEVTMYAHGLTSPALEALPPEQRA